jgi:hypothetical protein
MGRNVRWAVAAMAVVLWTCGLALAAGWSPSSGQITLPNIIGCGQPVSGHVDMTIDHFEDCALSVWVDIAGHEVLKNGAATLKTSYKITGVRVTGSDANWVSSDDILTRFYTVTGTGPTDTVSVYVQAEAPGPAAPPAGDYTAKIIIRATWQ